MHPAPPRSITPNPATRQLVIFAAVGIIATATHASSALIADHYFNYPPLAANMFGYICAFLISYLGNARLTFKRRVINGPQFARFMTISLLTLAFNQGSIFVLTESFNIPFSVALIPTVILVPIFSFVTSKLWAFNAASYDLKVDR